MVTVLDNFSSGKKHYLPKYKKLKIIKGDVINKNLVTKTVKDQEVIFNLAALPFIPDSFHHPSDFLSVNTMGSVNVLWNAINAHTPALFIHISTSEVYGSAQYIPIDEKHPLSAQSPYAASKIAADQLAISYYRSFGTPVKIVRPFNTFGPRQ